VSASTKTNEDGQANHLGGRSSLNVRDKWGVQYDLEQNSMGVDSRGP
jgi:hypothetical protein